MHFRSFIILALLSLLFSCSKKLAPQQGLVGEYLFKQNSIDQSTFRNHGVVMGATPVRGHKGKSVSAYHFNGIDQYITIPHASQNNFVYGQDFSISMWVAVDSGQTDLSAGLNDIMRKWRGDTQGYPFAIVYYNTTAPADIRNKFGFVRYDGSICRDSPQIYSAVTMGTDFVHLVFLKQGDIIKLYLNGELISEATDTMQSEQTCGSHNDSAITLGTRANKVRYFSGKIDDLRLYNRALTLDEIKLLFKL
jgi:hypothetical protein